MQNKIDLNPSKCIYLRFLSPGNAFEIRCIFQKKDLFDCQSQMRANLFWISFIIQSGRTFDELTAEIGKENAGIRLYEDVSYWTVNEKAEFVDQNSCLPEIKVIFSYHSPRWKIFMMTQEHTPTENWGGNLIHQMGVDVRKKEVCVHYGRSFLLSFPIFHFLTIITNDLLTIYFSKFIFL